MRGFVIGIHGGTTREGSITESVTFMPRKSLDHEGVEAHGQVNRGIKSVGRDPQKRAKTKVGLCKMISKDLDFL